MIQYKIPIFFLFLLSFFEISQCYNNNTMAISQSRIAKSLKEIRRRVQNFLHWFTGYTISQNSFIGRCAHMFKALRMSISFIIFKLGVIVTSLLFLSLLMFKSIAIGVVLLVLTSVGLATKFVALKHHEPPYIAASPPGQGIHLHIYNKGGSSRPYHEHSFRDSDDLYPTNELEQSAVDDLYRRLGFKNSQSKNDIESKYFYR